MLIQAILLLPFLVSLIWTFLIFSRKRITGQLRAMGALTAFTAVCFLADAILLFGNASHSILLFADSIFQAAVLTVLPCCFLYVGHIAGDAPKRWILGPLFLPVAFFTGAALAIRFMAVAVDASGFEDSFVRFIHMSFVWVLAAEMALLAAYLLVILHRYHFEMDDMSGSRWSHGSQVTAICISILLILAVFALKVYLGSKYLSGHPAISVILAVVMAVEIFRAAYSGICLFEFEKAEKAAEKVTRKVAVAEPADAVEEEHSEPVPVQTDGQESFVPDDRSTMERLRDNVERYMSGDPAPYLNPNLTIADVAEALGTNRTYISVLMNQYYGQNFRDYIAAARVNTAKRILLEHPELPLDAIAEASGYLSSSQLIKKFKESEGVPPRTWVQQQKSD